MEKRYQVFVSSTFLDLQEERQEVMQAILELECIPSGMELFPAADDEKWELIKNVISNCDYYVVIVGGRYGSTDSSGLSFTEKEFDFAVAQGIPVMAFLHKEPTKISVEKSDLDEEAREQLKRFRLKLEDRPCRYWKTAGELGGLVSRSLVNIIRQKPAEGWVRARFGSSPEEAARLRTKIDQLEEALRKARTEPPKEAAGLSQGSEEFAVRAVRNPFGENVDLRFEFTWDGLFACVGPAMFGEATEGTLKNVLRTLLSEIDGRHQSSYVLNDEDFQTIKVQLIALGLIEKSERKRSIKDTATYWTLTPYGEHYATVLKAIPRTPSRPTQRRETDG